MYQWTSKLGEARQARMRAHRLPKAAAIPPCRELAKKTLRQASKKTGPG